MAIPQFTAEASLGRSQGGLARFRNSYVPNTGISPQALRGFGRGAFGGMFKNCFVNCITHGGGSDWGAQVSFCNRICSYSPEVVF